MDACQFEMHFRRHLTARGKPVDFKRIRRCVGLQFAETSSFRGERRHHPRAVQTGYGTSMGKMSTVRRVLTIRRQYGCCGADARDGIAGNHGDQAQDPISRSSSATSEEARSAVKKVEIEIVILSGNSSFRERGAVGDAIEGGCQGNAHLPSRRSLLPRRQYPCSSRKRRVHHHAAIPACLSRISFFPLD
jgi:hypothetical protein